MTNNVVNINNDVSAWEDALVAFFKLLSLHLP